MKTQLTSPLLKKGLSNALKREIVNLYGAKPGFPQGDQAVDEMLSHVESLMPQGDIYGINESKKKVFIKYLCKGLFNMTPPDWVLGEDDPRVKNTLQAFMVACKDHRLEGTGTDINTYGSLSDVLDASTEKKQEDDTTGPGFTLDNLPEEAEVADQPGNPRKAVAEGSTVIATEGEWKVYRVKQGSAKGKEAASWLGCNSWWDVHWCIGRDYAGPAWKDRPYINEGDFYFFVRSGRSVYAMSTSSGGANLWNPPDSVIWSTESRNEANFPSLQKTAKAMGMELNLSDLSTLPHEIMPVLRKAVAVDPYLAKVVPASQLQSGMTTDQLASIVANTDAAALVADLNNNTGYRAMGVTKAILGICVDKTNKNGIKEFEGTYDDFSEQLMLAYIEAIAAAGWKEPPASFEAYLEEQAKSFTF